MAGGKLSPRQKMINLMYLVFIAMLALNMSKEVLSAFGLLNNKIETANTETSARNAAFMEGLNTKASDEPAQYAAVYAKAQEIEKQRLATEEVQRKQAAIREQRIKDSIAKIEEAERQRLEAEALLKKQAEENPVYELNRLQSEYHYLM